MRNIIAERKRWSIVSSTTSFLSPHYGNSVTCPKEEIDIFGVNTRMLRTPNDAMLSQRDHWVHSLKPNHEGIFRTFLSIKYASVSFEGVD